MLYMGAWACVCACVSLSVCLSVCVSWGHGTRQSTEASALLHDLVQITQALGAQAVILADGTRLPLGDPTAEFSRDHHVAQSVLAYMCVCVCVRERERHTHTHRDALATCECLHLHLVFCLCVGEAEHGVLLSLVVGSYICVRVHVRMCVYISLCLSLSLSLCLSVSLSLSLCLSVSLSVCLSLSLSVSLSLCLFVCQSVYATSWFEQTRVLCRRSFVNSTRTWGYFVSWILGLAMFLFYGTLYLGYAAP
jgi:hypothetical protein